MCVVCVYIYMNTIYLDLYLCFTYDMFYIFDLALLRIYGSQILQETW
jgi:hypothetical protein